MAEAEKRKRGTLTYTEMVLLALLAVTLTVCAAITMVSAQETPQVATVDLPVAVAEEETKTLEGTDAQNSLPPGIPEKAPPIGPDGRWVEGKQTRHTTEQMFHRGSDRWIRVETTTTKKEVMEVPMVPRGRMPPGMIAPGTPRLQGWAGR